MAATDIEWATDVWNFVRGCRRISLGCGGPNGAGGCYAEKTAHRFGGAGQPYEGLVALGAHGPRWTGAGRFVPEKLAEPLRWRKRKDGTRRRVFVNSMSDLFFEEFTNEQIAAGFGVMAACPDVDFLILTKRPKRAGEWFTWVNRDAPIHPAQDACIHAAERIIGRSITPVFPVWPLPNVWLGVSAENQQTADERIPHLLATPAAVRFVSAEPLLGALDLTHLDAERARHPDLIVVNALTGRQTDMGRPCPDAPARLDWVIVGGESGPGARPCNVEWIRSIVRQCKAAGVACFVKQLGARPSPLKPMRLPSYDFASGRKHRGWIDDTHHALSHPKGADPAEWPDELRVQEFPEAR